MSRASLPFWTVNKKHQIYLVNLGYLPLDQGNEQIQTHYIVSIDKILNPCEKSNLCSITFDDGWLDNYETAFPILKKYKIPATIFITVNYIDTFNKFWFDSLFASANIAIKNKKEMQFIDYFKKNIKSWNYDYITIQSVISLAESLKSIPPAMIDKLVDNYLESNKIDFPKTKKVLGWDEIREMGAYGITFGSHGLNHDIISMVDNEAKAGIINKSFDILNKKNINFIPYFSYPNGNWNLDTLNFLKLSRYKGAVTTQLGNNKKKTNPFLLKRIGLCDINSYDADLLWFNIGKAICTPSSS